MARRLKGEGSLYQTKDKTWVCQYYGDDGKRHTKRFQRKVDGRAFLDGLRQDEPTAMLDPQGRIAVMKALKELHEKYNMTIIMITHFMEEAMQAQRIIVMDNGKVIQDGTPKQIFENKQKLHSLGLEVPLSADIADELRRRGIKISADVFTAKQLAEELGKIALCQ